jgi:hypothetical protein
VIKRRKPEVNPSLPTSPRLATGDSALGLVDVSIIALAERLRITRVLTLDQRHFRFVRPRHCAAFEVVP